MPTPEAKLTSKELPQRASTMSPERIWHDALSFLQAELPRQFFETWIRHAEPIRFKDNTLVLSVANEFTQEKLEDDYQGTIHRILSMVVGHAVDVQVIVNHEYDTAEAVRPTQDVHSDFTEIDPNFEITLKFRRHWEEIVDPEKVVPVSRYFLKYWLPVLGPNFSSTVLAFKQIRFLHGAQADNAYEVSLSEIMRWHSIKKSAFYKQLENPHPLLSWFVEKTPLTDVPYERSRDGQIRQKPKTYIVYAGIPLCPPHQLLVENLLRELGASEGPDQVVDALEAALKIPDSKLQKMLDQSFSSYIDQGYSSHPEKALTVFDLARGFLDQADSDIPLDKLARLSEELENRLVRPDQVILLTWYFCREWNSLLTSPAFWLIVYLRSLGYYDRQSSEVRDTFWIEGGFKELSKRIGVSEDTISGWFGKNRKSRMSKQSGYVQQFITERKRERGRNKSNGRSVSIQLKVHLIDPLIPKDEKRFTSWASSEGYDFNHLNLDQRDHPEKTESGGSNYPEIMEPGGLDYPVKPESGRRVYPEKMESDKVNEPEKVESGGPDYPEKSEHIKNLKNQSTLNPENTSSNTTTSDLNQLILPLVYKHEPEIQAVESSSGLSWDLTKLTRTNYIPSAKSRILEKLDVRGMDFAAWILYAYSGEGRGIDKPALFAASKLLENPPLLPQSQWMNLAKQGPDHVRRNIQLVLDPLREDPTREWAAAMGKVSRERLEKLARDLDLGSVVEDP